MRASVLLPTKDRGPAIEDSIRALLEQDFPAGEYEIVLVDNLSSPDNRAILEELVAAHPSRLRYVREERLGLNNARNRGITESRGEILAFLDDDAIASPHWLSNIVRSFDTEPEALALGSKVIAHFTTPAPAWVDERLRRFLSSFDLGEDIQPLHLPEYPRGANMAFRRRAFEQCGLFLDCFDRKGDSLMSYGDIEICYRIHRAGHEVLYIPDAEVDHLIRGDRLTPHWFDRRFYWQGRSEGLFDRVHRGRLRILRKLPYHLLHSVSGGDRYERALHRGYVSAAFRSIFRRSFS